MYLLRLVTTVTRFKAKIGCVDQLVDALRTFDNSNSVSWQILALDENELVSIHTYDTIEDRVDDIVNGLEWLDSVTPLLETYGESRTQAFSGIVLHSDKS